MEWWAAAERWMTRGGVIVAFFLSAANSLKLFFDWRRGHRDEQRRNREEKHAADAEAQLARVLDLLEKSEDTYVAGGLGEPMPRDLLKGLELGKERGLLDFGWYQGMIFASLTRK